MKPEIAVPATLLLVIRAYTKRSLTILGIISATVTAIVHALHPSPLPFTLLCTFFLIGTAATKVKHDIKASLTLSSSGSSGGEGARTSIQVIANSGCASLLCLLHVYRYSDIILVGIVCNYVAVAADTFSSELGILSTSKPILITTFRTVPPGTNGGVTFAGLLAGVVGSAIISFTSLLLLPFCSASESLTDQTKTAMNAATSSPWPTASPKFNLFLALTLWGACGSLLDSVLGALLQASVIDRRTGKIVEGPGGKKVLLQSSAGKITVDGSGSNTTAATEQVKSSFTPPYKTPTPEPAKKKPVLVKNLNPRSGTAAEPSDTVARTGSRALAAGRDLLDNNEINLLMAATMTVWGMAIAAATWRVDLFELFA